MILPKTQNKNEIIKIVLKILTLKLSCLEIINI